MKIYIFVYIEAAHLSLMTIQYKTLAICHQCIMRRLETGIIERGPELYFVTPNPGEFKR